VSQRTYPNGTLTNDLNLTIEQWIQIWCGCSHKQKRNLEMNTQAQSGWGVALTGSVHHMGKTSRPDDRRCGEAPLPPPALQSSF
jgi:hypothetical protein